jgi:hypothetical protein
MEKEQKPKHPLSEEWNVIFSILDRCPMTVSENYGLNRAIESINQKFDLANQNPQKDATD